jgi:hypothetical protein
VFDGSNRICYINDLEFGPDTTLSTSSGALTESIGTPVCTDGSDDVWVVYGKNPSGFGGAYELWLAHFTEGPASVGSEEPFSSGFHLEQNYPNPFNNISDFGFGLPALSGEDGQAGISDFGVVSLKIYDLLGREVATLVNERLMPGRHTRQWDARGLPSGVYFYTLRAGLFQGTRKLMLLR